MTICQYDDKYVGKNEYEHLYITRPCLYVRTGRMRLSDLLKSEDSLLLGYMTILKLPFLLPKHFYYAHPIKYNMD